MTDDVGNEFKRTLRLREKDDPEDFDTLVCKKLRGMNKSQANEWIRGAVRNKFALEQIAISNSQSMPLVPSVSQSPQGVHPATPLEISFARLVQDVIIAQTQSLASTKVVSDE